MDNLGDRRQRPHLSQSPMQRRSGSVRVAHPDPSRRDHRTHATYTAAEFSGRVRRRRKLRIVRFHTSVKAHSLRCPSSPNRTRFAVGGPLARLGLGRLCRLTAGLRFGLEYAAGFCPARQFTDPFTTSKMETDAHCTWLIARLSQSFQRFGRGTACRKAACLNGNRAETPSRRQRVNCVHLNKT